MLSRFFTSIASVWWKCYIHVCYCNCASLPSFLFTEVMLSTWNLLWWEYLYRRNQPALEGTPSFFSTLSQSVVKPVLLCLELSFPATHFRWPLSHSVKSVSWLLWKKPRGGVPAQPLRNAQSHPVKKIEFNLGEKEHRIEMAMLSGLLRNGHLTQMELAPLGTSPDCR